MGIIAHRIWRSVGWWGRAYSLLAAEGDLADRPFPACYPLMSRAT
jgi:hypothetical protein